MIWRLSQQAELWPLLRKRREVEEVRDGERTEKRKRADIPTP